MSGAKSVLFITPWPSFWEGGAGIGCSDEDEVARGLEREGFDLHFVLPRARGVEPPGGPEHFHTGPHISGWGGALPSGVRRPLRYYAFDSVYTRLALGWAGRIRPGLVVGHSYYAARPAVRVARRLGVPSVIKFFGVMSLADVRGPEWLHRLRHWETLDALNAPADRVVILDDGTRGDRAALRFGVRPERLCFWPNGLDKDFRTRVPARGREELRRAAGIAPDAVVVVALSRLVDNKRVDLALEALSMLGNSVPFHFMILGDGPLRAGLEATARQLQLAHRVTFLGALPHDDVFDWLKASDIFLSTSELTNRSLSTLEAMMCGLPVVATDTGATREVLTDGESGYLTTPAPRELAHRLGVLVRDGALRARMGRAAYDRSAAFPGWKERVEREVALYRELMGVA